MAKTHQGTITRVQFVIWHVPKNHAPPARYDFNLKIGKHTVVASNTEAVETAPQEQSNVLASDANQSLWGNLVEVSTGTEAQSYWAILLFGFLGGGLVALMTPCVWPMIPMTVAVSSLKSKSRSRRSIRDAIIYALSIIAIFLDSRHYSDCNLRSGQAQRDCYRRQSST